MSETRESSEPPGLQQLTRQLEWMDTNQGQFLRIYTENLRDEERKLLEGYEFEVREVKSVDELVSEETQRLILASQYICYNNRDRVEGRLQKPHLPFRVALVISPAIKEAAFKERPGFSDVFVGERMYGTSINLDEIS